MNKFLNQGAKFLLPENLNYYKLLKIFYNNLKKTNQEFQNKEEIYNICKNLEEFKEMERIHFDEYIQTLCDWGNLEKSPKLETIDKYNEFIKEKQFYKITSNTIVLLEAVKKIEQS